MVTDVCADCSVRDKSLCSSLSDHELVRLNAISRHKYLERGATLMWAGDEGVVCGNILSGILKVTALSGDAREQIVGLLYTADFVGRPESGETPFSISALTDSQLCIYPHGPFQAMLDDHVAMERLLLRRTMAALDEARSRMLMLARGTASEKLASFLLEIADRSGVVDPDGSVTIELPVSRGEIADILGLTIETVSRQMTHFRLAGLLALPGGRAVTIPDRRALRQRAIDG